MPFMTVIEINTFMFEIPTDLISRVFLPNPSIDTGIRRTVKERPQKPEVLKTED